MRLIDLDAAIDAIARIKIKDVYDEKHAKGITVGLLSAIDELERLPVVNRWIPVTEALPETYQTVLITDNETVHLGELNELGDWQTCYYEFSMDVKAWMSVPKPYEGEEDDD